MVVFLKVLLNILSVVGLLIGLFFALNTALGWDFFMKPYLEKYVPVSKLRLYRVVATFCALLFACFFAVHLLQPLVSFDCQAIGSILFRCEVTLSLALHFYLAHAKSKETRSA